MSCCSYQMVVENKSTTTKSSCCNGCYNINCEITEQDKLISQLKTHLFDLELREKDYNILNERYNQLLHDVAQLNDCKLQLECEKQLRDEKFNKSLQQLQGENESSIKYE